MSSLSTQALLHRVRREFVLDWHGIHGAPHWARVRHHGRHLARKTGASVRVAELFAFLHDSQRTDEGWDHEHGVRSSALIERLGHRALGLSRDELQLLSLACREHSEGHTDADITVQVCWDADRLDLGRVGIEPDPARLCTAAARNRRLIARAYAWGVAHAEALERPLFIGAEA